MRRQRPRRTTSGTTGSGRTGIVSLYYPGLNEETAQVSGCAIIPIDDGHDAMLYNYLVS